MSSLTLTSLGKTYPVLVRALHDVTLSVAAGERLVLLGPSGSGKTTLLRLVAGLETPTAGAIEIGGRSMAGVRPHDRGVALVTQDRSLYPHLTVSGNLAAPLRTRKVPGDERARRVAEVAARLDLAALLDRRPDELSGGERQRAALGRALVVEPACVLLDEPLSHLDPALRRRLRGELRERYRALGATVVHVTHDQDEAMALGDRIAILRAGRLVQVGSVREIYDRPVDRFVASFFGDPPMCFVDGRAAGRAFSDGHGLDVPLPDGIEMPDATPVVLGIRPEAIAPSGDGGLRGTVRDLEPRGSSTLVAAATPSGARLHLEVPVGAEPRVGEELGLIVDPAGVHVFAPGADGVRLS